MRSILVTGGAGFIGSHTCLELLKNGYYLIVIDSYINSSPKIVQRLNSLFSGSRQSFKEQFKLIKGDIRDKILLESIFKDAINNKMPIEAVIHFAGLKSVEESVFNPSLYWEVNVGGSITLLRIMEQYNCRNIVFSSSATIYNCNCKSPLSEECEIKPINTYGQTKAAVENLLFSLYKNKRMDWRIINLRYFNPVGAHSSGMIGEDPRGEINNLFPYLNRVASGAIKELRIFGNNWPTLDGTGVRDYIHIMDLANAHYLALKYLLKKKNSGFLSLNIGTGKGTSVLELIKTYEEVNSCKIPFIFVDRRPGDVAISFAKNNLATSTLGWKPKRDLSDICRDGWKWEKLNPNGYT